MAGLYVHIPFCVRKCPYCDFYSIPLAGAQPERYVDALVAEMALRAAETPPVSTIYLGGGTPTALPMELLTRILEGLRRNFAWQEPVEVTVEANPGTVEPGTLAGLRAQGVNRLSIGLQALDDGLLTRLGRIHTAAEGRAAVAAAREAGFDNLSVDLIFAIPGETLEQWERELAAALDLGPEHISAYGLTYEPGTPFHGALCRRELAAADEETEAAMFEMADRVLPAAGYEHYEISNYARPGRESQHNLNYWRGGEYLGLGAAAHSHRRGVRWSNVGSVSEYEQRLAAGVPPVRLAERLSAAGRAEERLLVGLRLAEGVALAAVTTGLGQDSAAVYRSRIEQLGAEGLVRLERERLTLTARGRLLANRVIERLVTPEPGSRGGGGGL